MKSEISPSVSLAPPGSLALLTDLYQLTMAMGYWKSGTWNKRAAFNLFFRQAPFGGGYAIAAGLQTALDWLGSLQFRADDLDFLAGLQGSDDKPLFPREFLSFQ
jgi:nicotinate phosphoribosyltransferase